MARKQNETPDEKLISAGKGALQRDYYGDIEDIAKEILSSAEDEHDSYSDASEYIYERIHEAADGSSWIIYTAKNLDVLQASSNWLAIEDQGLGGEYSDEEFTNALTQAAYWAFVTDLQERVEQWEDQYWKEEEEEDEDNPRRNNPADPNKGMRAKLLR